MRERARARRLRRLLSVCLSALALTQLGVECSVQTVAPLRHEATSPHDERLVGTWECQQQGPEGATDRGVLRVYPLPDARYFVTGAPDEDEHYYGHVADVDDMHFMSLQRLAPERSGVWHVGRYAVEEAALTIRVVDFGPKDAPRPLDAKALAAWLRAHPAAHDLSGEGGIACRRAES